MLYVIAFIGFLVAVYFITKLNKGIINKTVQHSQQSSSLPELARVLGLSHQFLQPTGEKDVFMETGEKVLGTYQGIPIEMVFTMQAKHGDQISVKYSYRIQKTVTLTVGNPQGKSFQILPKNTAIVSKPAGLAAFDNLLLLTGDLVLPKESLEYFASLGWMNLSLRGSNLIFEDNYYEGSSGMMSLSKLGARHPVWGNTPTNPAMDMNAAKGFIDRLIDLSKKTGLVVI